LKILIDIICFIIYSKSILSNLPYGVFFIMKYVQPIRDLKKIEELKVIFHKQNYRNFFLFLFGINTGLRISDILKMKVSDVRDRTHITIQEQKTGKEVSFRQPCLAIPFHFQYSMVICFLWDDSVLS